MKAHILYRNYLTPDGKTMSIGGIQTYISNLSRVLINMGYHVSVYQISACDFEHEVAGVVVYGFSFNGKASKQGQFLYNHALKYINLEEDLLIFGDEAIAVTNSAKKSIGIQHGVFWDKPNRIGCSRLVFMADFINQAKKSWNTINRIKAVTKLVCVDYNFVNWYRALVAYPEVSTIVIPNFSVLPEYNNHKKYDGNINIIFARRFFDYRGTRVFADAISRILQEYENLYVTVAGDGPDEKYLHEHLDRFNNVSFIKYQSKDSLRIHADKHVALVPTLGSEGTSLSLLEAMASQCAVICTNVGGLTNLVVDHYNGLIINPDADSLYESLKTLIDDRELMARLAKKAYEMVSDCFSLDVWERKWEKVIKSVDIK